ncbi:MAG: ABC transporter substrate-binding protein, partial [Pseudodonghicola sp.]
VYIVPPAYWAEVGADGFGAAPIGTGPFKLEDWRRDDRIVMTRNEGYWGTPLKGIERVILRPVPDDMARAAGIEAGEFDIATNIPIANAAAIEAAGKKIVEVPSYRIFSLELSNLEMHPSPMHDKLVRQAVNYAIDKEGIIDGLFEGRAKRLNGQLLRSNQLGYNPDLTDYPYDPEKAKALLAEAGYPNGFDIDFRFPSGRYVQDQEVATAIAGMLEAVGIRPNMIQLEAGEFLRQLVNRELAPVGYVGLGPADDPDLQMAQYRSNWRYSYVSDPEIDRLIDAGAAEMNSEKRAAIYQELSAYMREQASVGYLFQNVDLYATGADVEGFLPRGDQLWMLYGVSVGKE